MLIAPVLREYRASDFDTLWMIDQACFEPGLSYGRRELAFYIDRKGGFTLVAQQIAKIVGFIVVHRNRRNQGHVITVDVLPETRRSGLGSRLLAAAEERLRTLGCGTVLLETAVDNVAAIGFYKRHNYAVVDRIPDYYLDSIDALVLAKNLDPLKSE
jgi:ribosomal-protein-alanine N-acetyltransferase